jgi:hypothetical protein
MSFGRNCRITFFNVVEAIELGGVRGLKTSSEGH